MSVRSTIQGFYGGEAPQTLSHLLDRYRDEERTDALRQAAEKIRRAYFGNGDPLGRHATVPITNAMVAADLIDPDKEDE